MMSTGLHGCFKTHPIPSAYPSPSTLAFPVQSSKPLHFLALLEGFSPSFLFFPSSHLSFLHRSSLVSREDSPFSGTAC